MKRKQSTTPAKPSRSASTTTTEGATQFKSRRTSQFRKAFHALPEYVQEEARKAFRTFRSNPFARGLQFKPVQGRKNVYSARVTIGYRSLCKRLDDDTLIWFWIGSHADYDRLCAARPKGQLKK